MKIKKPKRSQIFSLVLTLFQEAVGSDYFPQTQLLPLESSFPFLLLLLEASCPQYIAHRLPPLGLYHRIGLSRAIWWAKFLAFQASFFR